MTNRHSLVICLWGFVVLLSVAPGVKTRAGCQDTWGVNYETYKKVVELVFPREQTSFATFEYRITLRYFPHPDPESQIIIKLHQGGRVEVISFTFPPGSKNLDEQLHELKVELGREVPEELAQRLPVKVETVTVPPDVMADLLARYRELRFSPQLESRWILGDEAGYELWYEAMSGDIHIYLGGPHPDYDKNAHPVIRWMNDVRRAVDKARQASE